MFRLSSEDDYDTRSEGGTRFLFGLDHFEFHDTLDGEGVLHQFVLELGDTEGDPVVYETDQPTMYELMARYLAGEYEKEEYEMVRSPAHDALLDLLEMATARARSGETELSLAELEGGEYEEGGEEDEAADEEDENRHQPPG